MDDTLENTTADNGYGRNTPARAGSIGLATAAQTQRAPGELPTAIDRTGQVASRLMSLAQALENQLRPVLRQVPEDGQKRAPYDYASDAARAIGEHNLMLEVAADALESILSRIEA